MQDLKIALVQTKQFWEDKTGNHSHFKQILGELRGSVDLILLPEMFDTAFSMNTSLAEEWTSENTSLRFLRELAQRHQAAIYTSVMCKLDNAFYNRGVFVFPNGEISYYDKRKTFGLAGEDKLFAAGSSETIVNFKGWKFQLQICYDLRFPEISRNRLLDNGEPAYDVLLYVANWPEKRSLHWKSLLQARAIENQCYVIGVNRVGVDAKDLVYSGDSGVVLPSGETQFLRSNRESTTVSVLIWKELKDYREAMPFLKDKQIEN